MRLNLKRETKRKTSIYRKDGGIEKANKDFDKMKPKNIKEIKDADGNIVVREGELPDGRTVKVRNKSSDGSPTVEINKTNTKGKERKQKEIRYD